MKNIKFFVCIFSIVLLFESCLLFVSAEESDICVSEGLEVIGAQIRISAGDKPQALRFTAKYSDELAAKFENCEYGFVVIPSKYVPTGESIKAGQRFKYEGLYYRVKTVAAANIYEDADGYITYTVCITGTKALNYDRSFIVAPYIMNADGEYFYGESYTSSIVDVANAINKSSTASAEEKTMAKKLLKDHDDAQWTGIYKP